MLKGLNVSKLGDPTWNHPLAWHDGATEIIFSSAEILELVDEVNKAEKIRAAGFVGFESSIKATEPTPETISADHAKDLVSGWNEHRADLMSVVDKLILRGGS